MKIQLSDHFTFRRLLRFTLPSIAMMIFSSVYVIVDGFFVSNYVGATAFAAVNLIMPVLMILSSAGFMIGTGGSALVSMTLGQGKSKQANEIFSLYDIFCHRLRCRTGHYRLYIYCRHRRCTGSDSRDASDLRTLRKDKPYFSYTIYAPECFSKFSGNCRETSFGACDNVNVGRSQYFS